MTDRDPSLEAEPEVEPPIEQGPSLRTVHVTAMALLLLWGTSLGLSYVHLGRWALAIALAIAFAKAFLVLLVFMELGAARFSIKATLFAALALVGVFMLLAALDVVTRGAPPLEPPAQSLAH